jgi:hypothetical protein
MTSWLKALPVLGVAGAVVAFVSTGDQPAQSELSRVVHEIEQLDAMRSALARGFGEQGVPATRETFQQVCRPVGMRAGQLSQENGWAVQQLAEKNRNPNNALDAEAADAFRLMLEDGALMGTWIRTSRDGAPGARYFRRIVVEDACLACHGTEDARPEFVKQGYPDDKAFDFEVGDLRGIYSVFVPDGS